ncbi:transcriptional regulator family: Fungal Specific TF [Aspergillus niger]|nr:transcriptional regulator family: Fungal Specific TF [Aspergillus niger]
MPPRLNHRKSTRGCRRCKARKVKCSETRPKCQHCDRHNLPCEYAPLEPRMYTYRDDSSNRSTSTASTTTALLSSPTSTSTSLSIPSTSLYTNNLQPPHLTPLNTTSLRLLHLYITSTSHTMGTAQIPSVREMWELSVPEMAFEYQPLLSTLLAVAAAHRARLVPSEAEELRRVQGGFIAQAVGGHRAETAKLAVSSSSGAGGKAGGVTETLCMNAILISLYTLACRMDGGGVGEYEPPNLWLNMARGVRTVVSMVYFRLVEERARIAPLLVAKPVVHRKDVEVQDGGPKGSSGVEGALRFLVDMFPGSEEGGEEVMGVYAQCVGYLEVLLMAVRMGESEYDIRKRFSSFPSMVPGEFLGLVSERRPRALVILAYLFALVKGAEGVWWLRGIPEMEVRGIDSILPEEWREVMGWPVGVVMGVVGVNESVL